MCLKDLIMMTQPRYIGSSTDTKSVLKFVVVNYIKNKASENIVKPIVANIIVLPSVKQFAVNFTVKLSYY